MSGTETQQKKEGEATSAEVRPKTLSPEEAASLVAENAAAAELAGAEESAPEAEKTLEAQAQEIADKHAATIPEGDRQLKDPREITTLLYVLRDALETPRARGVLRTSDHLGNLPSSVKNAIREKDRSKIIEAMRAIADADVVAVAAETDKIGNVANSFLPDSVKRALLNIHLKEGEHTLGDSFRTIADRLASGEQTETCTDAVSVIVAHRQEMDKMLDTSDKLRQVAIVKLVEQTHPELMNYEGTVLLREIWGMSYDESNNKEAVETKIDRYRSVAGDSFSKAYPELAGAQSASELTGKLHDGSIKDINVKLALKIIERELGEHIAKQLIPGQKG